MKARHGFASFLGPDIEHFLAHKRSAGRRYEVEEKTLRLLDDFLLERHVLALEKVTPALIDEFLASRPRLRPRSYNHLRCTIGRLFAYLVSHGKVLRTPLQSPPRRSRYQRSPFIFDQAAARRLLATARALADRGGTIERGNTYHAIFAILYGLGLRVGEVCRLCVKDVDLERRVLVVRETKFYKSRLVASSTKQARVLPSVDLDLQLERRLRIDFGRELEYQVHRVPGLLPAAFPEPRQRRANRVDRAADGLGMRLDQIDILRVAQRLLE